MIFNFNFVSKEVGEGMKSASIEKTVCGMDQIFFPEGIIGFGEYKKFAILKEKSREPFLWLQSAENQELSFIIIDPKEIDANYAASLCDSDKAILETQDISDCQCFSIVYVPKDSDKISANLLAPIVVNRQKNVAKQVILQDQEYSVQHIILDEMMRKIGEKDVSSFAETK